MNRGAGAEIRERTRELGKGVRANVRVQLYGCTRAHEYTHGATLAAPYTICKGRQNAYSVETYQCVLEGLNMMGMAWRGVVFLRLVFLHCLGREDEGEDREKEEHE